MRLDPDNAKRKLALNKSNNCERLKQQGNEAIKKMEYVEAQAKYTQALNLDPFNNKLNAVIYSNRALTYMKKKDSLKAVDDLNKPLDLNPQYSKSLIRRAEVNMERGQYSAAIMDYNKIEELDPSVNVKAKIKKAQKKEKLAKKKDYYMILEIQRHAEDTEIKKAYKALALKYHPYRNIIKSQAEQDWSSKKFKCFKRPNKKQMYDSGRMGYDGDQGDSFDYESESVDPNDIFKMSFGGGREAWEMGGGNQKFP